MTDEKRKQQEELDDDELKDQEAEELPDREAMSVLRMPWEPSPPLPESDV
jgi:hypothetical protein